MTDSPIVEQSDWFTGDVDCDGNELITIRADELQKLRDEREKFMWQVRDTCVRAEKAEAALLTHQAERTALRARYDALVHIIHTGAEEGFTPDVEQALMDLVEEAAKPKHSPLPATLSPTGKQP